MSRAQIIVLSVVSCVFGALSLLGPQDHRADLYLGNVVTAVTASIFASIDLRRRGYSWGWLMLLAYLAPLIGTVLYIVFSDRRSDSHVAA